MRASRIFTCVQYEFFLKLSPSFHLKSKEIGKGKGVGHYLIVCLYGGDLCLYGEERLWCMCLYEERYAGTGIRGFICILKARGYSSISFVSLRVPWTYLV